jgi:hypothetical protein
VPTRTVPVTLSLGSEKPTQATALISDWTLIERLRRGAVVLAICWSLAGVSIIIPGFHFIGPPVLLLLGPILFVWRLLTGSSFKEVSGDCPRCKSAKVLSMGGKFEPEANVFCEGCGNQLTLRVNQLPAA